MTENMYQLESHSAQQTEQLALALTALLQGGDVITLSGDLGAGKTTLTQGIGKGLGVKRHVNSPTFTLVKEYQGETYDLYHMDMYRIEDELEEFGLEEYIHSGNGIVVIEWPQKIAAQLPAERLHIEIKKSGEDSRVLQVTPYGDRYHNIAEEWVKV
ncbi:tRNA (adenosine(37)-N6)-threonylcarbamoyltransferase complex ATPase subunit type 1 TsaE [Caldalkalibacillus salinus]|uniref:tRNA (adenosine(37)-N6)-threonylcarbamoyltransferase complex ATPase subunit type 1 TsaE n=1 Tax=Caldalkalibacillus salinus TaxID=2803787 RepID=UPI001F022508|nr:tRNA (adenosine(37)-N6)-threonylcarbamoyltransferase complex ATPase subunit type 1 TsaE [Caldalkalibacillus salinus]